MNRTILLVMALMAALGVKGQLLWKIEGGGLKSPSYVVGTHHLAPFSTLDTIAGIREAMKNTSQVVGEIAFADVQKPENMQLMQSLIMVDNDSTLKNILAPIDYLKVSKAVGDYLGFSLSEYPTIKPAFISNNIIVAIYSRHIDGYRPQDQLDTFFQSFATDMGRPVMGLETPEFQFRLLYSSQSLRRQAEELVCEVSDIERTVAEARELTDLYMHQNIEEMLRLSEQQNSDGCGMSQQEMETMLYSRNADWARKLPAMMSEAPSLIVVGALHLPGDRGLLALLRRSGYNVTAVR